MNFALKIRPKFKNSYIKRLLNKTFNGFLSAQNNKVNLRSSDRATFVLILRKSYEN